MDEIFEEQMNYERLKEIRPDRAVFGYKIVILLLGSITVIATWLNH